jgi:hypothetical protein
MLTVLDIADDYRFRAVYTPCLNRMGLLNGSDASTPRYIAQSYNHADSHASALRLILTLNPHWEGPENKVEFVRFTDGITNTVRCSKITNVHVLIPAALQSYKPQARLDRRRDRQGSSTDESVR